MDKRRPRLLHQLGRRRAVRRQRNEQRRVRGAVLLQRTMERCAMRQWERLYMHAGTV